MSSIPPAAPAPAEPKAEIGAIGRIFGVLFSPGKTFTDIARKPSWLLPILLTIVLALVVTYLFGARIGWERFAREQMMNNPNFANMAAAQQNELIQQRLPFFPIFGYIGAAVAWVAIPLVFALIYWGAFNVLAGTGARFKQAFGAAAHSIMPFNVAALLGILIIFLKDPADVDLQNLVGSNLGALLDSGAAKWLLALGKNVDIFVLWVVFLLGIGFAAINPKKASAGKGIMISFAIFGVYVLGRVAIAAITS